MTLEELEQLVNEAYASGMVRPLPHMWTLDSGVDGTVYCCGLTAAYLQAGNTLAGFARDDLEGIISQWAADSLGVPLNHLMAFIQGFDGDKLTLLTLTPQILELYALGKRLGQKWCPPWKVVNRRGNQP